VQVIPDHENSRLKQLAMEASLSKDLNLTLYKVLLERRRSGEPLQYIEEEMSFYDIYIDVNQHVLIPRPETEFFVETVIDKVKNPKKIIDVGTGSGCIGLSLAKHFNNAEVHLTDISSEALNVAEENSNKNEIDVRIYKSNLLKEVSDNDFDLIVANLPYIPSNELQDLPIEVLNYEPILALDGGKDGLDLIAKLVKEANNKLTSNGLLALEIDSRLGNKLKKIAKDYTKVEIVNDLTGRDRYVFATK
tara:strand:- start:175 stop:918 length:744 start_codon:yes stop_codon:yes gene_type:complete